MLVLQNLPPGTSSASSGTGTSATGGELSVEPLDTGSGTTKFDLTLSLTDFPDGFSGSLQFSTDLFLPETARNMADSLVCLLEGAVQQPSLPVSRLPLLPSALQHRVLREWSSSHRPWLTDSLVPSLFEAQAALTPDSLAVTDGSLSLSFRELNSRSNQLAHLLRHLGVGPDVRVAFCLERSSEAVLSILAILKAGGAYVPLDPSYPSERLAFMLRDSGAAVLLTRAPFAQRLPDSSSHLLRLDESTHLLSLQSEENLPPLASPSNLAYVIYTSGSTGLPKGVMVTHDSLLNLHQALREAVYQGQPPLRVGVYAPLSFDASVKQLLQLLSGHALCVVPEALRLDVGPLLAWLAQHRVDVLDCTPSLLRVLLDAGLLQHPSPPRFVLLGGEAIDSSTWALLRSSTRTRFVNVYGPTECTVDVTALPLHLAGPKPVLGRPLANVEAFILDSHLQPLPPGVPGELFVGGLGLSRGYLLRPDLTAEKFLPNPFSRLPGARLYRTGDLCRFLHDGSIDYLGRTDFQVKLRGFRIELGEVEAALSSFPSVRHAAAAVLSDSSPGGRLVAYLVSDSTLSPSSLREFLERHLPLYMVPSAFVQLDSLPLTPSGKLDRKALPPPDSVLASTERVFIAPRTPTELLLASLWAGVLNLPSSSSISARDDFFSLGGHSLLATQLVSRVRSSFNVELPLRALFEASSLEALAARIDAAALSGSGLQVPALVPAERSGPLPLSFAQQRLWFLD